MCERTLFLAKTWSQILKLSIGNEKIVLALFQKVRFRSDTNYELMICTKVDSEWAAGIVSDIALYTLEAALRPGNTMDMSFPNTSKLKALIFAEPKLPAFRFWGREYGILLCLGITRSELEYAHKKGSVALLKVLEQNNIIPYTDFDRDSVI